MIKAEWTNADALDLQPTCNKLATDCISRQAAIDALDCINGVEEVLRSLPSAQPKIIKCEDCKWYGRADKRRFYRGMDCLQRCIDTIIPDKDFCSRAERRTDETD